MVTRLLKLRVALALSPFRGGSGSILLACVLRALYVLGAAGFAATPVLIAGLEDSSRLAQLDIVFGALLLTGMTVLVLCVPRFHLDARTLSPYPVSPVRLSLGLLATAPVTWSGVAGAVWLSTFVSLRSELITWNVLTVAAVIMIAVLMIVSTRAAGTLGAVVSQRLRTHSLRQGIGILILVAMVPILVLIGVSVSRADGAAQLSETSSLFAWTPFGAAFSILGSDDAAVEAAIMQLGSTVAVASILVGVIISLTTALMQRLDFPAEGIMRDNPLGWFGYLPNTPVMTIGARSLTYWMKDPRYIVSLAAIPIIPILVVGTLLIAGVQPSHLAVLPIIIVLVLLGWMVHNDIATDSTAMWIHVASGIRGLQDRIGRLVPVFVFGVPILVLGTSITVLVMGNWQAFPAVFATGSVALCVSAGLSSVVSALKPYPTSRPGESPFVQPTWHGAGAGISQTVSLMGSAVLVAPPAWVLLTQPDIGLGGSLTVSAVALLYGVVVLVTGVFIGSAVYNRRSSELLAFTQMFD